MYILFIILCAIIGFGTSCIVKLTAHKVENKMWACGFCCIEGILVAMIITILSVYLLHPTIVNNIGTII